METSLKSNPNGYNQFSKLFLKRYGFSRDEKCKLALALFMMISLKPTFPTRRLKMTMNKKVANYLK
jgi:hypothetical protein